jgi:hypothetical protein
MISLNYNFTGILYWCETWCCLKEIARIEGWLLKQVVHTITSVLQTVKFESRNYDNSINQLHEQSFLRS